MSLKAFHIFFIAVSILLAFGFGGWAIYTHGGGSGSSFLVLGMASIAVGVLLMIYGRKVLRTLRDL